MIQKELMYTQAAECLTLLRQQDMLLGCAESCTGGLLSANFTNIPGCSDVFVLGQVAYANAAKSSILDIDDALISQHGAVSAPIAMAMAMGAGIQAAQLGHQASTHAALGISTTGIAGPESTGHKPVGLVFIGLYHTDWDQANVQQYLFSGQRDQIRTQAVTAALAYTLRTLKN